RTCHERVTELLRSRLESLQGSARDWRSPAISVRGAGPRGSRGGIDWGVSMAYGLVGRAHARVARAVADTGGEGTGGDGGLVLLVAVLIAGVVKASGGFSDTGIADAVVRKVKGAIVGVGE